METEMARPENETPRPVSVTMSPMAVSLSLPRESSRKYLPRRCRENEEPTARMAIGAIAMSARKLVPVHPMRPTPQTRPTSSCTKGRTTPIGERKLSARKARMTVRDKSAISGTSLMTEKMSLPRTGAPEISKRPPQSLPIPASIPSTILFSSRARSIFTMRVVVLPSAEARSPSFIA